MRKLLLSIFIYSNIAMLFAQNSTAPIDFYIQGNEVEASEFVQIALRGEEEAIKNACFKNKDIHLKYEAEGWFFVSLPLYLASQLVQTEGVKSYYFDDTKGIPLTDNSRLLSGAEAIQNKTSNLSKSYSGKGVVMGIIDAGIDLNHPDFRDSLGNSRVIALWDQVVQSSISKIPIYGYGNIYYENEINAGTLVHQEPPQWFGHGSNVSGIAAGNGRSYNAQPDLYKGMAPDVKLVVVSINFNSSGFTSLVADATHFIYSIADSLGLPVVINASLGTYVGSKDGWDAPAQAIRGLTTEKNGRAFVCAAGNGGEFEPFHLRLKPEINQEAFGLFHPISSGSNTNNYYVEAYFDSTELPNLNLQMELVDTNGLITALKPFTSLSNLFGTIKVDTLQDSSGNFYRVFQSVYDLGGGVLRYLTLLRHYSGDSKFLKITMQGQGTVDFWGDEWVNRSKIARTAPAILNSPQFNGADSLYSIVSSWAAHPGILSVGNFENRNDYLDVDNQLQIVSQRAGNIAKSSSKGPNRKDILKPDFCAPGDFTIASGNLSHINTLLNSTPDNRARLGIGGMHYRNGGTSMASPVVSGGVALLLEKCPEMHYDKLLSLANTHTNTDNFTLSGDSVKWGKGKFNIQNLMEAINHQIILPFGDTVLCENISIPLSISPALNNVIWQDSINSNQFLIDKAGTYYVKAMDSIGCWQYSDTVSIEYYPSIPFGFSDTSFCDNSLWEIDLSHFDEVIWQDGDTAKIKLPQQSGMYTVSAVDSNNCNYYDQFVINDIYVTNPPVWNQEYFICPDDSLVLQLSGFSSYLWGNQSTDSNFIAATPQFVSCTLTDVNNCTMQISTTITKHLLPEVNLGNDTLICANKSLQLSVNNNLQAKWSTGDSINAIQIHLPGAYHVSVTDINGCTNSDTLMLDTLTLPYFNLEDTFFICNKTSIVVKSPVSATSYNWRSQSSLDSIVIAKEGYYWLELRNSNNCSFSDTFNVIEVDIPSQLSADTFVLCHDASLELKFEDWEGAIIWFDSSQISTRNFIDTGFYWVSFMDTLSMCSSIDSFKIKDAETPGLDLGGFRNKCKGLATSIQVPDLFEAYIWNTGARTNQISVTEAGTYVLSATDIYGCKRIDSILIIEFAAPIIHPLPDTAFCEDVPFSFNYSPGDDFLVFWEDGSTNKIKLLDDFGKYNFDIKDNNNCLYNYSFQIKMKHKTDFDLGGFLQLAVGQKQLIDVAVPHKSVSWSNGFRSNPVLFEKRSLADVNLSVTLENLEGCFSFDTILISSFPMSAKEIGSTDIKIYPNPGRDYLRIEGSSIEKIKTIEIYSVDGRLVYRGDFKAEISIGQFSAGIYYISLQGANIQIIQKLVFSP